MNISCYACGRFLAAIRFVQTIRQEELINLPEKERLSKEKDLLNELIPNKERYCCRSILITATNVNAVINHVRY